MPIFVLSASFFKIFRCHQISAYCPSPLSRIGNVTTLFHRAIQNCRVARNKCIISVHSNLVCVSADILRNVHNIYAHVTHTYMRIPSAECKVVQVHRVNGSSELIYTGWQPRFVSRYAQQKQYKMRNYYKITSKRGLASIAFCGKRARAHTHTHTHTHTYIYIYIVNMKIALTDTNLVSLF